MACFPATHLFPLEGHSNWLSYTLVAKKQCGGILKIEQPVLMSTQRMVVGRRPHARTRVTPSPGATCFPHLMGLPDLHPQPSSTELLTTLE